MSTRYDIFVNDWTEVKLPNYKRNFIVIQIHFPSLKQKSKTTNNFSTQFTTRNRFAELSYEDQDINMEINTDITEKKIPTIFIKTINIFVTT